jgi:hypothetical protein
VKHALVVALVIGCSHHSQPPDTSRFDAIELASPPGVSDLTIDDRGVLWAIPERDRVVLEIAFPSGKITPHPLDGVPAGLDTESLTWLSPGHFAIGTEGQDEPTASVLYAEARGDHEVVTGERPLTAAEIGTPLTVNHGAEGLCGKDGDLIVAIESVGKLADGTRWAPLVRLHGGDVASVSKLRLTSQTGKLSAITCTFAADGSADAYAIERHYAVHRLLHFTVPAAAAEVTPTVVVDLDAIFHGSVNLEGVVRLPDGRFVLVNDNQGNKAEGPTDLFVLRAR